ncbi:hypothetical protein HZS_8180 [Henneguya salminicola]|nr:hypothetical protein HZS_8180 [Henneguya salminicola]
MVDYSRWNKIEVSDDEDDTHPNIDTPSLFRWRHQARVERMEALKEKIENLEMRKKETMNNIKEIKRFNEEFKNSNPNKEIPEEYMKNLNNLENQMKLLLEEEITLNQEIKSQPLNVDTLSKEKFSKSLINPVAKESKGPKNDDDTLKDLAIIFLYIFLQQKFMECHKKDAKHYGMLSKYPESAQYLNEHPYLASEEAASFLCIWCIDLAVEEKYSLMERVAKQAVCLQFLLEIARSQKAHPRDMINLFFQKVSTMEGDYKQSFESELEAFKSRVKNRANARIEEAQAEERKKRLGPGGLDPIEVMESLPTELQECFNNRDIELLKTVLTSIPPNEAEYHLKRCIDSGLWVPNANTNQDEDIQVTPQPENEIQGPENQN